VVHVPGAAEIVLAFEDHVVAQPQPVELDARAHAAETRADDDRFVSRCHVETSTAHAARTRRRCPSPRM